MSENTRPENVIEEMQEVSGLYLYQIDETREEMAFNIMSSLEE